MGSEDLPVTNTQPPHDGFSFLAAKLGVCIYRGHQDRRILIIFSLFCGQTMGIDVDISCKCNVVIIVCIITFYLVYLFYKVLSDYASAIN